MPTPLRDSQLMPAPSSVFRRLNRSNSSDDCSTLNKRKDKFNIRAMPDPLNTSRSYSGHLNRGNNSHHTNDSDHESNTSRDSEMFRSFSHSDLQRPVSVPPRTSEDSFTTPFNSSKVEKVELNDKKLSPRAHLPPFHLLRSPSAPPVVNHHPESDADDFDFPHNTSGMGGLIERFEQDHALRISSPADVTRRYSEGYSLLAKRDKDRTPEDGDKWLKPNTVRHRRASRLQAPLSHSHESLIALEHDHQGQRMSLAGSVNNINARNSDDDDEDQKEEEIGRVAGWAVNFEKLLKDGSGLVVFTEFLKKEFSQENIIFWKAVEQYKKIIEADKRKAKAKEIFMKHVSVKATDPINIEQNARQQVEKQLDSPSISTFERPQQEIFKLMKQDSYPRFIKSELYKVYLMREMEGKPLQLPKSEEEEQTGKGKKDKKKSKDREAEEKDKEKRRRSLLPLPWNKKTSKQNLKASSETDLKKQSKEKEKMSVSSSSITKEVNNNTTSQRKPASGPGIDLSTMRKEVQANTKETKDKDGTEEKNMKFCRVILPDGSTTVVCTKPGQNIRTVLGRLCEKRGLSIAAVDVFLLGSDKPLDMGEDISSLGSKEVMIERRVLFRMDLPHRKSIGVKAKPNRTVRDVFKPILNKYGFKLDNITVQLSGQTGYVDIDEQVSTIDNQRVVISTIENSGSQGSLERNSRRSSIFGFVWSAEKRLSVRKTGVGASKVEDQAQSYI